VWIDLANKRADKVWPTIRDRRAAGATYQAIADELNALGVITARGGKWYPTTVKNAEARMISPVIIGCVVDVHSECTCFRRGAIT